MPPTSISFRPAEEGKDERYIAQLWHDVYHESHSDLVPKQFLQFRTSESFAIRASAPSFIKETIVATKKIEQKDGPNGKVVGFITTRVEDYEIYQLFVSKEVRGLGVATKLMREAEKHFRSVYNKNRILNEQQHYHEINMHLYALVGNTLAVGFYEKCGWKIVNEEIFQAEIIANENKDFNTTGYISNEHYKIKHFPLRCYRFEKKLTW